MAQPNLPPMPQNPDGMHVGPMSPDANPSRFYKFLADNNRTKMNKKGFRCQAIKEDGERCTKNAVTQGAMLLCCSQHVKIIAARLRQSDMGQPNLQAPPTPQNLDGMHVGPMYPDANPARFYKVLADYNRTKMNKKGSRCQAIKGDGERCTKRLNAVMRGAMILCCSQHVNIIAGMMLQADMIKQQTSNPVHLVLEE